MNNKKLESELTYVRIDEIIPGNPDIQIRIWDKQQSREVGCAGELKLIDFKVTLPLPLTYLDKIG